MILLSTFFFTVSYLYGAYADLKHGRPLLIAPLFALVPAVLFSQSLTNTIALTGIGLVLWSFRSIGFSDVAYLALSGAFLSFIPLHVILLGMTTTPYIYGLIQNKRKNREKIRMIPGLLLGNILTYLIFVLL